MRDKINSFVSEMSRDMSPIVAMAIKPGLNYMLSTLTDEQLRDLLSKYRDIINDIIETP